MAQRIVHSLIDDLDGSAAEDTIEFALDGVAYKIDLSQENVDELRDRLAVYVEHARQVGGSKPGPPTARAVNPAPAVAPTASRLASDREKNATIREWARRQGYQLADRGRIPIAVAEAYRRRTRR